MAAANSNPLLLKLYRHPDSRPLGSDPQPAHLETRLHFRRVSNSRGMVAVDELEAKIGQKTAFLFLKFLFSLSF